MKPSHQLQFLTYKFEKHKDPLTRGRLIRKLMEMGDMLMDRSGHWVRD